MFMGSEVIQANLGGVQAVCGASRHSLRSFARSICREIAAQLWHNGPCVDDIRSNYANFMCWGMATGHVGLSMGSGSSISTSAGFLCQVRAVWSWHACQYVMVFHPNMQALCAEAQPQVTAHLSMRSWSFISTSASFMCWGTAALLAMARTLSPSELSGPFWINTFCPACTQHKNIVSHHPFNQSVVCRETAALLATARTLSPSELSGPFWISTFCPACTQQDHTLSQKRINTSMKSSLKSNIIDEDRTPR